MNSDDDLVRRGDVFAIIQEALANAEAEGPDASLRGHLHIGIADVPAAPPPAPAWEGSIAQRNLGDAWAAMRMIREAVETLGPIGAMPAEEHLAGPTFLHEAEAIVAGIMKMQAAENEACAKLAETSKGYPTPTSEAIRGRQKDETAIELYAYADQSHATLLNAIALCLKRCPSGVHGVFIDVQKFREECRRLAAMKEAPGGIA